MARFTVQSTQYLMIPDATIGSPGPFRRRPKCDTCPRSAFWTHKCQSKEGKVITRHACADHREKKFYMVDL